jgi:hypothetical protein
MFWLFHDDFRVFPYKMFLFTKWTQKREVVSIRIAACLGVTSETNEQISIKFGIEGENWILSCTFHFVSDRRCRGKGVKVPKVQETRNNFRKVITNQVNWFFQKYTTCTWTLGWSDSFDKLQVTWNAGCRAAVILRLQLLDLNPFTLKSKLNPFTLSSVRLTTDWTTWVRSPTEAEDFSSSLCVQTGSGAHRASCQMGTGGPFPGAKARPGRDADHSPPSSAEVKNE